MSVFDRLHGRVVYPQRVQALAEYLAAVIPRGARVLDVGCGDGEVAGSILRRRPDLDVRGVDVLVRERTRIPVSAFDGSTLPVADDSVDVVMFVDVLHHTDHALTLLREAVRVTRRDVVVKDHVCDGRLARWKLRFMDHVGNARHGVALPHNYWTWSQWEAAFAQLPVRLAECQRRLALYPGPAGWLFDSSLQFLARLQRGPTTR
jgi:SAM-dependent methyltransferase